MSSQVSACEKILYDASPNATAAISIKQGVQKKNASLSIDKVRIRYGYDSSPSSAAEYHRLLEYKKKIKVDLFKVGGKVWSPSKKSAITKIHIPIGVQGGGLLVQYGFVHEKYWSWVEFNPAKLSGSEMAVVSAHLDLLFAHGGSTLLQGGRLSRLDVAFDAQQASMDDYLFLDGRLRTINTNYFNKGSLYLGSKYSLKGMLVYDKAKELLDKQGIAVGHDWFRIEARVRNPKQWAFADIWQVTNPFEHLLVIDKQAWLDSIDPALPAMRAAVEEGMQIEDAYWHLPTAFERKQAWKALQGCQPAWWKPAEVWLDYQNTLDWIPGYLGTHAPTQLH